MGEPTVDNLRNFLLMPTTEVLGLLQQSPERSDRLFGDRPYEPPLDLNAGIQLL